VTYGPREVEVVAEADRDEVDVIHRLAPVAVWDDVHADLRAGDVALVVRHQLRRIGLHERDLRPRADREVRAVALSEGEILGRQPDIL
jgi:hypothetical protein